MISLKNNFYRHVNNEWLQNAVIPDEYSATNTFIELKEQNDEKLLDIINNMDDNNKFKILYNKFLNRNTHFNFDNEIETFLIDINCVRNKDDLLLFICKNFIEKKISNPFSISVDINLKDANRYILDIGDICGLGLPDKDYYFEDNHESIKDNYIQFMGTILSNFSIDHEEMFYIESQFADSIYSNVEEMNSDNYDNQFNLDTVDRDYPNIQIKYLLQILGIDVDIINISNPRSLKQLNKMWDYISLSNWKKYFTWMYLKYYLRFSSLEYEEIFFDFYHRKLLGKNKMKSLDKRSMELSINFLGFLLSQDYVDKYFDNSKRNRFYNLIYNIKNTFRSRLKDNHIFSQNTIEHALIKLDNMTIKFGSPNDGEWKDYSLLNINSQDSIIKIIEDINHFNYNNSLNKLHQNVDRTEWFMYPHEINAYYCPNLNEIVFPAGILQEPFFYNDDDNIGRNYGGIGAVIAHEITHGFDNNGRKFDAYGKLHDWWTEDDVEKYNNETKKLVDQFNQLIIEGEHVDGELTLGENLADLGGVTISYNALLNTSMVDKHINQFFRNYANIWKIKSTSEYTKFRIQTDPHSPGEFRCNQILSNFNPFYNYYDIGIDSNMYIDEDQRVILW